MCYLGAKLEHDYMNTITHDLSTTLDFKRNLSKDAKVSYESGNKILIMLSNCAKQTDNS